MKKRTMYIFYVCTFLILSSICYQISTKPVEANSNGKFGYTPPPTSESTPPPKAYAVFIGINYSNHKDKDTILEFAEKDAQDMADLFFKHEYEGKPIEGNNLLTYHPGCSLGKGLILGSSATKRNIIYSIKELLRVNAENKDIIALFYFSGHGAIVEDKECIIPYGADVLRGGLSAVITIADLKSLFSKLECQDAIVMLDMCLTKNSGQKNAKMKAKSPSVSYPLNSTNLKHDEMPLTIITSCSPGTPSYENKNLRNSLFTSKFLEECSKNPNLALTGIPPKITYDGETQEPQKYFYEKIPKDYLRFLRDIDQRLLIEYDKKIR